MDSDDVVAPEPVAPEAPFDVDAADAPDAPQEQPKRWGIGLAVAGWVVSYLLAGIAVGVYALFAGPREEGEVTLGLTIAVFVGLWTGMLGTVVIAKARQPAGTLRSEFGWGFRWLDVPLGVAAGIVSQIVLLPLIYLPWMLSDPDFNKRLKEPAEDLTGVADGAGFWVLALFIAIGAPIVEELFYRGLVQHALVRRLRPPVGVALASLLFGLAHQRLITLPGLTAFAVVLGVLTHKTKRLGPAIVAHMAFNAVTVIALGTS